jgi:NAD(P)-dependent dehydrogenase (short-subunit alcohol dehydrogenase family)
MRDKMSVVLITGCSSGFGLAATIALAERGLTVVASMRDLSKADMLKHALGGRPFDLVKLDITNAVSRQNAVNRVFEKHGAIDILVNNAGIFAMGAMEVLGEENLRRQFETNVFGTFSLTNLIIPSMRQRRAGRIVNVTSAGAFLARQYMTGYAATKHAMDAITIGLDLELKPFNVRVCSVAPVQYGTSIADNTSMPDADTPYGDQPVKHYKEWRGIASSRPDLTKVTDAIVDAATNPHPKQRYLIAPGPLPIESIVDAKTEFDEERWRQA